MHKTSRRLLALLALLPVAASAAEVATGMPARPYPPRSITIVVPFTHGGPTDDLAQALAQAMGRALGQRVVEKNVVGAGGTLAAEQVAKAKPDGTTLLLSNIGHATAPALHHGLRYRPVEDFAPIGLVADVPMTLVAARKLAADGVMDLPALARARAKKLTYGHAGPGSASQLCGLLLMSALRTDFATLQYQGTVEARTELAAGRFDLMCDQVSSTLAPIRDDRLKAIAVTSPTRLALLPAVPTLAESGLAGFELIVWHGLYAPAGTPAPVLARLAAALQQALQDPLLREKYQALGARPASPEQARPDALRARLAAEVERWQPVIRQAGAYAD